MRTRSQKDPGKMAISVIERELTSTHEDPTMAKLKTQVSEHEYAVDSALVAEEILRKLRMIKWARQELTSASGRTQQPKLRGL